MCEVVVKLYEWIEEDCGRQELLSRRMVNRGNSSWICPHCEEVTLIGCTSISCCLDSSLAVSEGLSELFLLVPSFPDA